MASPTISNSYPANNDVGIPVGIIGKIYFDRCVELESVKNSIVLYGNDFDKTIGADQASWVNKSENNFFLQSPGFKGILPVKIELAYYTLGSTDIVTGVTLSDEADEISENVGHVALITVDSKYNATLPESSNITLLVSGDPANKKVGICSKTTYDIDTTGNSGNGSLQVYGIWNGSSPDTVKVKITTTGTAGTAVYKWWYESSGESSAVIGKTASRRYRTLADNLQIRFDGSNLEANDVFTFEVRAAEYLEDNHKIVFSTNDGSYLTPPSESSTPVASQPVSSDLPGSNDALSVVKMIPEHGSYNISAKNRTIIIEFSEDIDPDTITNENIKIFDYPVSGQYSDTRAPKELQKVMTIEENILTIKF